MIRDWTEYIGPIFFGTAIAFIFTLIVGFAVDITYGIRKEERKIKAFESCIRYKPAHQCYDGKIRVDK